MKVSLIDYTGAGSKDPARYAMERLVFTKQTRLNMTPALMSDIENHSTEELNIELQYMANTIPSSWEFINYSFLVNDVTRAFTHQLVRTRTGSYAQQTLRVLDVSGWGYLTGPTIKNDEVNQGLYDDSMKQIAETYDLLIERGAAIEDARGVLPTNILTNIVVKFDLRTLSDTMRKRASSRTQGEYRSVMDAMRKAVLEVHPFTELFFNRTFDQSASDLEYAILDMNIPSVEKTRLIKLIDQMRTTA